MTDSVRKEHPIVGILTWLAGLVPGRLRRVLCTLLFRAACRARDKKQGLCELLLIHQELSNRIDEASMRYEGGIHPKHRLIGYHEFFTRHLVPGERVLDVGCGYGALAFSMASAGADVTGIDINADSIRTAQERFKHPRIKFITGDALSYDFAEPVDTVVLSNVLEHIQDRPALLRRIQDSTRPKRWLIRVPWIDRHWMVPLCRELGLAYFSDVTHFTEYTLESFPEEMTAAGFKVTEFGTRWGEIWAEVVDAPGVEASAGGRPTSGSLGPGERS